MYALAEKYPAWNDIAITIRNHRSWADCEIRYEGELVGHGLFLQIKQHKRDGLKNLDVIGDVDEIATPDTWVWKVRAFGQFLPFCLTEDYVKEEVLNILLDKFEGTEEF